MNDFEQQIQQLQNRLLALDAERETVLKQLSELGQRKSEQQSEFEKIIDDAKINHYSSTHEKINLFRDLFKGRTDVYPKRYESKKTGKSGYTPVCANEWRPNVCHKPRIKCSDCQFRVYSPVTDQVIANHLAGNDYSGKANSDFVAGIYPLLSNEHCWFLAVDFDEESWMDDIKAFLSACKDNKIPCAIERSRSGKGGHVWIFFTEPVTAMDARKLGAFLLTSAMDLHPELGFKSYDRLFPNQDTMPKGGFGNLIALPLQKKARENGNSVFINENFTPYPDQWAYLASIFKITPTQLAVVIKKAEQQNKILGVRLPIEEDDKEPWKLSPSRKPKDFMLSDPLPKILPIVLGNQIFIAKAELPKLVQSKIIQIAAFQNPEFYKKQALRQSTHETPRVISCAEYFLNISLCPEVAGKNYYCF
ncbi:hypothetical protein [Methylomonas sp. AM2-LC]|uniref:TOTE conflict system archaeo-eukaryotic primase domain-containing protein n=1 Tax=Methylomonas sp. AM2-LC TaxID=3153301 RepID=UPI0032635A2B